MKFKIGHVADIQVKNRENNLYLSYQSGLDDIINLVTIHEMDSLVIAGDFFEYAEANDSERKLIYNFLSKLSNVPTLKEIVFIIGNHDELKEKKKQIKGNALSQDVNIGYNPVNVFVDLINNLSVEASEKFIYMNKSKIYDSKISDKIKYISYSLEDNLNIDLTGYEPESENIYFPVYHGMLKEYVDISKLPIRKDIYEKLDGIDIFPANTHIFAGDIHQNLTITGEENRVFIYPGSTQQHTHSEGNYIHIGDKVIYDKNAEKKCIKMYNVDDATKSISIKDIEIKDFVQYHTIILDHKYDYEVIKNSLINCFKEMNNIGLYQNFFEIKSSNLFITKEMEIFNIITESLKKVSDSSLPSSFYINISYDKVVKVFGDVDKTIKSEIVKEVINEIAESNDENKEDMMEMSLEDGNIDKLILNNEQVEKLFNKTLVQQIKSVKDIDNDLNKDDIKNDLIALFKNELNNVMGTQKRYDIKFIDIYCSSFMALGENTIKLDIPGIVRILGTNGIGKTTLFNMMRWIKSGEVYEWMKSNKVNQNNLVIFNKNLDIDNVKVSLNMIINGRKVNITRTIERKWKTNTTDEQKQSKEWKDYIAEVSKEVYLKIDDKEPIKGENAQHNINLWFGEYSLDIMIINAFTLDQLVKSSPEKLNETVLNIMGVEYLNKLEENLDNVKKELMNVSKPVNSKDNIQMIKIELDVKKDKLEEEKISLDQKLTDVNTLHEKEKQVLSNINNALINSGNIPELIKSTENELNSIDKEIENFQIKQFKLEIPFTEKEPQLDKDSLDSIISDISENDKKINQLNEDLSILDSSKKSLIESYIVSSNSLLDKISEYIGNYEKEIEQQKTNIKNTFDYLNIEYKNKLSEYVELKNAESEIHNKLVYEKISLEKENTSLKESLNSGVCSKCNRAFDEASHKIHVEETDKKIQNNNENIQILNPKISASIDKVYEYEQNIKSITSYISQINYQDCKIFEVDIFSKYKPEIDAANDTIKIRKEKIDSYILIKNINEKANLCFNTLDEQEFREKYWGSISSKCKEIYESLIQKDKEIKEIDLKCNEIKNEIKNLNSKKDIINNEYNEKLKSYNDNLKANIEENNNIRKENEIVAEHNKSLDEKKSKRNIFANKIKEYEKNLPLYLSTLESKNKSFELCTKYESEIKEINENITKCAVNINDNNNKIKRNKEEYENYLKYQKNNVMWSLYNKLIKNNLKDIVFEYYRTFLNNTLNQLLSDVNFKLFWDNNSQLYLISFKNGKTTYAPANQSSGMEIVFLGLSLVYTMHLLNVKNSVSHIFIDELSGALNKGDMTSYQALDYQNLFVKMLNKFKDKTLCVVDHNIKNMFETVTYEVLESQEGNYYKQLE